jgi:hypothetical protein
MKREPLASEREQVEWLQRLLRRRAAAEPPATASGSCLDAQTLAAWADGGLNRQELAAAEMHASSCARCLALLAAIERTAPPLAERSPSRLLFRWLVPLAGAAAAVALWVAIPEQQAIPVARESASTAAADPEPVPTPPAEERGLQAVPQPPAVPPPNVAPQPVPRARADAPPQPSARSETLSESVANAPSAESPAPPAAAPAPPASFDTFADTGAAAQRRSLSKAAPLEAMSPDPLIRWRVVSGTQIDRSTNGGETWIRTATPAPAGMTLVGITAVDALNATVRTAEGRAFSTTDGGITWTPVQENPPAPF